MNEEGETDDEIKSEEMHEGERGNKVGKDEDEWSSKKDFKDSQKNNLPSNYQTS